MRWALYFAYPLDICQDGIRERRPLHTDDKKKALGIWREVEASILGGRWNVKLARETRYSRAVERFGKEYESLHHSASTQTYTKLTFERLGEFLKRRCHQDPVLDTISQVDVVAFQRERAATLVSRRDETGKCIKVPISVAAVNRDMREISTLFKWAVAQGCCRINPCADIRALKGVKRHKQPLTPEEIGKLVAALPETLADVTRLILNTGLRLGEALHLRKGDVDLSAKILYVRSRKDYMIKDREERQIPLNAVSLDVVSRRSLIAGDSGLLFATSEKTVMGNRNALRDLYVACAKAGIRRISWYLLRHTFATVQAGYLTPYELKAAMGHSDIRTADRFYVHLEGKDRALKVVGM